MLISRKSNSFDLDALAENLAELGRMAASTPPAYKRGRVREPIVSSEGKLLGWFHDGAGVTLNTNLKDLGITKRIPFVKDRDWVSRILDKVGDESGLITTLDGLAAARAAGLYSDVYESKASITTVANTWSSMYAAGAGTVAAGTFAATPGAAKNRTDGGALSFGISNPTTGTSYLLSFGSISAQQINMIVVADLLVAVGAINGNSSAAQTVSSAALTRYTTGVGVYATNVITTALGATPANFTMSYTNDAGTSGQVTSATAMLASGIVNRLTPVGGGIKIALAAGDAGVRAVATTTLSAAMGASSAYALTLYKQLMFMPGVVANIYSQKDTLSTIDSIVPLVQDSVPQIGCLFLLARSNTTSTGVVEVTFNTAWS